MLTVVTPATNKRLTTVSAVRSQLGITEGEAADPVVEMWIDQASQMIVDYCGRDFAAQVYREENWPTGCYTTFVFSRDPVFEVVSVNYRSDLLAPADYRLDGIYLYRVASTGRVYNWLGGQMIVEYKAGYQLPGDPDGDAPRLPATIELACLGEISARQSRASRDPLIRSESVDGVGSTSWQIVSGSGPLTNPDSAGLLSRYKTLRVG